MTKSLLIQLKNGAWIKPENVLSVEDDAMMIGHVIHSVVCVCMNDGHRIILIEDDQELAEACRDEIAKMINDHNVLSYDMFRNKI